MSLILNLQFWNGDKAQAMSLARLIADIEPVKRSDVSFLFSCRFDSSHDWDTVEYVKNKFAKVYTHKTTRQGTGWPQGPNQMFADSYGFCIERTRDRTIDATGILFMEADCVPLDTDWINLLKREWENCKKQVLGCWLMHGDCGIEHINGNCIIHKDFWRDNKQILQPASGGWDAIAAPMTLPRGYPSKLIFSDYAHGTPANPWVDCDHLWSARRFKDPKNALYGVDLHPVWLHGVKDIKAQECVRDRLVKKIVDKA